MVTGALGMLKVTWKGQEWKGQERKGQERKGQEWKAFWEKMGKVYFFNWRRGERCIFIGEEVKGVFFFLGEKKGKVYFLLEKKGNVY